MNIEIKGLDKLIRKYRRIQKDLSPEMMDLTQKAADYALSQIPGYPPPPPTSDYRRSGTLGRTTKARARKRADTEFEGVLGNPTWYSPFVVSAELMPTGIKQTWFHAKRWWTLQAVVLGARDKIVQIYEKGIRKLLRAK